MSPIGTTVYCPIYYLSHPAWRRFRPDMAPCRLGYNAKAPRSEVGSIRLNMAIERCFRSALRADHIGDVDWLTVNVQLIREMSLMVYAATLPYVNADTLPSQHCLLCDITIIVTDTLGMMDNG